jgi:multicomponent Na+:H+ antiporter subunit C
VSAAPYLVAVWLALVGLYGIVTSRHLVHMAVSLSVLQSSTYVLLLAIGYREGAAPPIFTQLSPETPATDPVVQALVLTDVVVGVTATALLLALAIDANKRFGSVDPRQICAMRG